MKMRKRYTLPGILMTVVGLALVFFGLIVNNITQASTTILGSSDAGMVMLVAGGIMVVVAIIIGIAIFFS